MVDKKNKSINHQSHSREEGQQNNIAPIQNDEQRNTQNHSQAMSNMMQDDETRSQPGEERGKGRKENDKR